MGIWKEAIIRRIFVYVGVLFNEQICLKDYKHCILSISWYNYSGRIKSFKNFIRCAYLLRLSRFTCVLFVARVFKKEWKNEYVDEKFHFASSFFKSIFFFIRKWILKFWKMGQKKIISIDLIWLPIIYRLCVIFLSIFIIWVNSHFGYSFRLEWLTQRERVLPCVLIFYFMDIGMLNLTERRFSLFIYLKK